MRAYLETHERRVALGTIALSALLVAAHSAAQVSSNPGSRLATMDALVHDGSFAIDASVFNETVDKVYYDGHYYSTKPPLLSVAGAGIYALLYATTGVGFRTHQALATRAINTLLGVGFHLVLLFYAWRLLRRTLDDVGARLVGLLVFGFGLLLFGYATTVNNHTPAAAALLASFYHAYCARHGRATTLPPQPRDFALAGLFAALAPTLDLPALFMSVALALYVLAANPARALRCFAPVAFVPLGVHFLLTYLQTGGLVPIYLKKQLYRYPGSYWNAPIGIDALDEPWPTYLFHMLLGHHGIFAMTPLLAVGVWQAVRALAQRGDVALGRREALVALVPFAILVAFYAATTTNYGGVCVGFRWLFITMPLLALFAAQAYRVSLPPWRKALFFGALVVGSLHAFDAWTDPWAASRWQTTLVRHDLAGDLARVEVAP